MFGVDVTMDCCENYNAINWNYNSLSLFSDLSRIGLFDGILFDISSLLCLSHTKKRNTTKGTTTKRQINLLSFKTRIFHSFWQIYYSEKRYYGEYF